MCVLLPNADLFPYRLGLMSSILKRSKELCISLQIFFLLDFFLLIHFFLSSLNLQQHKMIICCLILKINSPVSTTPYSHQHHLFGSFNIQIPPNFMYVHCLQFLSSCFLWTSLVAQLVRNPLARQGTLVQFLGCEDPLEKG